MTEWRRSHFALNVNTLSSDRVAKKSLDTQF